MLVLSRKLDEEIVIAGGIRVRVLELGRGRVRLGISAPPDVAVSRAEILLRDHSMKEWTALTTSDNLVPASV